jgi:hypothetical protein
MALARLASRLWPWPQKNSRSDSPTSSSEHGAKQLPIEIQWRGAGVVSLAKHLETG